MTNSTPPLSIFWSDETYLVHKFTVCENSLLIKHSRIAKKKENKQK